MTQQAASSEPQGIDTKHGRIVKYPDGIICFYMLNDLMLDIEDAKQMVLDVRSLAQSNQIRLMFVYGINCDVTFGAQRYFSTVTDVTHFAFVVNNRLQVQVGSFLASLMRSFRAHFEFRLFFEAETALVWLRQS